MTDCFGLHDHFGCKLFDRQRPVMRLIILAQLISGTMCQQYHLVGPPARCNEVDMFMPTTQALCYAAAEQMSRRHGLHGPRGFAWTERSVLCRRRTKG